MANIIRHGKTPQWGVTKKINGLIIDSFSETLEIKDYEQTDEKGAVCGYLVYDQTKNFDFSATVIALECQIRNGIGNELSATITINNDFINPTINTPSTVILKSLSYSETAGGATTISGSGTAYAFGADCKE